MAVRLALLLVSSSLREKLQSATFPEKAIRPAFLFAISNLQYKTRKIQSHISQELAVRPAYLLVNLAFFN